MISNPQPETSKDEKKTEPRHLFPELVAHNHDSNLIVNNDEESENVPEGEEEESGKEGIMKNSNYFEDNEDESIMPKKVLGNVEKKGDVFGIFHFRYLELNVEHRVLKRYLSVDDYPNKPK